MKPTARNATFACPASRLLVLCLAGCNTSPEQNLLGSFFPAWMLCAVVGIISAITFRRILSMLGVSQYVIAPPLTYLSVAVLGTLLAWLLWLGD
jgi:hypothetical protein